LKYFIAQCTVFHNTQIFIYVNIQDRYVCVVESIQRRHKTVKSLLTQFYDVAECLNTVSWQSFLTVS
jgi:hypothetical protein